LKEVISASHPQRSNASLARPVLLAFAHLNAAALGVALGLVCGLWIFVATAVLLIRGGNPIGPTLSLLAQYFPGYTVTWSGAFLGFLYAFALGFIFGFIFAYMRNAFFGIYIHRARQRAEQAALSDLP
jgi:hypothetical protein